MFEKFNDLQEDDAIEAYDMVEVSRASSTGIYVTIQSYNRQEERAVGGLPPLFPNWMEAI